jgi:hypothetical protein
MHDVMCHDHEINEVASYARLDDNLDVNFRFIKNHAVAANSVATLSYLYSEVILCFSESTAMTM